MSDNRAVSEEGQAGLACLMGTLALVTVKSIYCSILSEENMQTCNLENLVATYHRYFSRQDNFRVGSAIIVFLRMRDLLPSPSQRLAAFSLLHELYRSDSASTNPFSLFFVECLQPTSENQGTNLTEQWFLAQILSPTLPREVCIYVCTLLYNT